MTLDQIFASIPEPLRSRMLEFHASIVANFHEGRWEASMLASGKFCEVVYAILKGYPPDAYPQSYPDPAGGPRNFYDACSALLHQKDSSVPESIRLLIPRTLPTIYQIRNKRGVGHIGMIEANRMDASLVLPACNWVLAELVRVFLAENLVPAAMSISPDEAQALVDRLTRPPVQIVWEDGEDARVLDITLNLPDQIVLLASRGATTREKLVCHTEHYTSYYMETILRDLSRRRLIDFDPESGVVRVTSLGLKRAAELAREWHRHWEIQDPPSH